LFDFDLNNEAAVICMLFRHNVYACTSLVLYDCIACSKGLSLKAESINGV
jgi:hypothetical protein